MVQCGVVVVVWFGVVVLCCVVLCGVVLCCVVLCCVVLCCAVLCGVVRRGVAWRGVGRKVAWRCGVGRRASLVLAVLPLGLYPRPQKVSAHSVATALELTRMPLTHSRYHSDRGGRETATQCMEQRV